MLGEQVVERRLPLGEDRDADQVVGDRGHVGLRPRGPVHLDVRRPRRHRDVAPQPEPAVPAGGQVETEAAADRRVQAVGRDEVAEPLAVDEDVVAAVLDLVDRAGLDLDAGHRDGVGEGGVQDGAADAAAVAVPEAGLDPVTRVEVGDAPRSGGRAGRRRGRRGRPRRRASAPRRRPCRPGRGAARGPRRRARPGRRTARWRARPVRHRRCTGRSSGSPCGRRRARGGRSVGRAGERGQCGVLHPDPHRQEARVEHREDHGGDPAAWTSGSAMPSSTTAT